MALRMKTARRLVMLMLAAMLTAAMAACDFASSDPKHSPATPAPTGPIAVVASLNQWASLAEQLGGKDVKVTAITPPATLDARNFEPSSTDIATLQHADIVVANGAGYDDWVLKNRSRGSAVVSAAETVGAMDGDNPQLWLSKDARAGMASELTEAFSKARPAKKKTFAARLKTWHSEEGRLEAEFAAFAKSHGNPTYAALDDSAFYLMSDLGFKDRTPQDYAQSALAQPENPSPQSSPPDIKNYQKLLEGRQVDVLIGNGQKPDETASALIASAKIGNVPFVEVPGQMPADASSLVDWVKGLASPIIATASADDESGAGSGGSEGAGKSQSTSPSDSGQSSSNSTSQDASPPAQ